MCLCVCVCCMLSVVAPHIFLLLFSVCFGSVRLCQTHNNFIFIWNETTRLVCDFDALFGMNDTLAHRIFSHGICWSGRQSECGPEHTRRIEHKHHCSDNHTMRYVHSIHSIAIQHTHVAERMCGQVATTTIAADHIGKASLQCYCVLTYVHTLE